MKMIDQHYATLKGLLEPLKDYIAPHRAALIQLGTVKDVESRLRWDMFWATRKYGANPDLFLHELYDYLNDETIDTALRSIIKEIEPVTCPACQGEGGCNVNRGPYDAWEICNSCNGMQTVDPDTARMIERQIAAVVVEP